MRDAVLGPDFSSRYLAPDHQCDLTGLTTKNGASHCTISVGWALLTPLTLALGETEDLEDRTWS